ncbi:MAG: B12-binding domain-containing radical SAM protein [bacterium]|nr:B12-binding domain-containing radical SAM protein [bacterium]
MKKIIFIEPKSPASHIFSFAAIPRLGSILLATILKQKGYDVRVYIEDMIPVDYSDVVTAEVIGISTITSTAPRAYLIADTIRKLNPHIPIVFGGSHPSFLPEEALAHGDYVVRGEGERTFSELIAALETKTNLDSIAGLSYRIGTEVVHTPARPFLTNLDENPIIDYSVIPNWNLNRKLITLSTSRGCPYHCKFCSVIPMFGNRYRFHSIDHVIREIKTYQGIVGHIFFADDNFTALKERTKALLRQLRKENISIEWSAQVRADTADDTELLDLMHQTGCFAVFIGFESINPQTLAYYDKHQTIQDIRRSIDAFHQRNIYIHGMFVLGSDYDTVDTIRKTTKFARKLDIDSVQFMNLTPLPGTQTYQELRAQNRIINFDWSKYDAHHVVFEPNLMTAYELQQETYRAMRKFYSWWSIVSRVLRFDFFYAGIKLYGKRTIRKARKSQRAYSLVLKQKLLEQRTRLKSYLPESYKVNRVGIPANMLEGKYRSFLLAYLKKLGVKVILANSEPETNPAQTQQPSSIPQTTIAQIQSELLRLKDTVDIVLVPYINDLTIVTGELWKKRDALTKLWLQEVRNTQKTVYLVVELNIESLAQSCSELGLLLKRKLRKGLKAYRYAQPYLQTQ